MTHRAESILAAFTTTVGNLTTTGTRVVRGRALPIDATPALSVDMGSEQPADDPTISTRDNLLEITVTAYVKAVHGTTDTSLNQIAAEVYAAVMANRTLGLAYVFDTRYLGRGSPQRDHAEQTVSSQELRFQVHYRHSLASAES